MSIITQAKAELDRINFGEEDTTVMVGILSRFFKQWDSGGAVSVAAPVLCRLLEGKPLSPLTGAADEWIDRTEMSGRPMWQNVRCSTVFKDASRAWDIDLPGESTITFPYRPGEIAAICDAMVDAAATGLGVVEINRIPMSDMLASENPEQDTVLRGLDVARAYIEEQRQIISSLRAQLEAEGAHTEAANSKIDELTAQQYRAPKAQSGG